MGDANSEPRLTSEEMEIRRRAYNNSSIEVKALRRRLRKTADRWLASLSSDKQREKGAEIIRCLYRDFKDASEEQLALAGVLTDDHHL